MSQLATHIKNRVVTAYQDNRLPIYFLDGSAICLAYPIDQTSQAKVASRLQISRRNIPPEAVQDRVVRLDEKGQIDENGPIVVEVWI
jgi:hypothetical protein